MEDKNEQKEKEDKINPSDQQNQKNQNNFKLPPIQSVRILNQPDKPEQKIKKGEIRKGQISNINDYNPDQNVKEQPQQISIDMIVQKNQGPQEGESITQNLDEKTNASVKQVSASILKPNLNKQFQNLIQIYGNKEVEIQNLPDRSKSVALRQFEKALIKRLQNTKIGNKYANEIFLEAIRAEYEAKRNYYRRIKEKITEKSKEAEIQEKLNRIKLRNKKLENFIDHSVMISFVTLITIYALFIDDVRVLSLDISQDAIIYATIIFVMVVYLIDIIISSIAKNDYLFSFFFWADILSFLSLLPDCGWIWNNIVGVSNSYSPNVTKIGQTSITIRATRIVKVFRIVRLFRITKLYKQFQLSKQKHAEKQNREDFFKTSMHTSLVQKNLIRMQTIQDESSSEQDLQKTEKSLKELFEKKLEEYEDDDELISDELEHNLEDSIENYKIPEESKISKILSDQITKTVIVLILSILFVISLLLAQTYNDNQTYLQQGIITLVQVYNSITDINQYQQAYQQFIQINKKLNNLCPLIFLQAVNINSNSQQILEWQPYISSLRFNEFNSYQLTANDGTLFAAACSIKTQVKFDSIFNIIRTLLILIILSVSSFLFNKDARDLVLDPLERMIEKVKLIAKNPLAASSNEINEAGLMCFVEMQNKSEKKHQLQEYNETQKIEQAIVKIGHLLALGFGEAGTQIIGQNLTQFGELNVMMPGERTYAIFGFCILDDFVESMEVLQEDIMTYVNQVAEITHSMVDRYGGAANKNIGEAFLLVWKFHKPSEIEEMDKKQNYNNKKICLKNQIIADLSVLSFLKIIAKINKFNHILKYNQNEEMKKKIHEDFKVRMGFGLHVGWAIEGAIGSHFKVDASYLSPNVNMAARLEAATKLFNTDILISGNLRDILSSKFQSICREIDTVKVKGSDQAMRIFTVSIQTDNLEPVDDPLLNLPINEKKQIRSVMKKKLISRLYKGERTTWQEITRDRDFIELRKYYDQKFENKFSEGYKLYISGDWQIAGQIFQELHQQKPKDGPTAGLNRIINEQFKRNAPLDWKGFRQLMSKS